MSHTDDSVASHNLDRAFDYFVEHVMLLVCCVHAVSQDSQAFLIASLLMVQTSSYYWMQPVLRLSSSVIARRTLSEQSNCENPFGSSRDFKLDILSSSSLGDSVVSVPQNRSTQQKERGLETQRLHVVKDVAPEGGVCHMVQHPPLLKIDLNIFTAEIETRCLHVVEGVSQETKFIT